ncbi:MAG: membrane protein insertion efficiency factor YidD [Candidatus Omnitrophica bacterium]|nr:membrane protein insertion efficiency factor YidD [Candidatus Omnitrophota bacterium]
MKRFILFLLGAYKKHASPLLPRSCRFYPTCSQYAGQSIRKYGIFKGSLLSLWRITRCNPFTAGGFDPVK